MARQIITAIDLGSSKVSTVIASIDEETMKPSVIGSGVTPSHGIRRGVVVNIAEAVNAINDSLSYAEKMAGITISQAIVSINGKNIFSNNTKGVVAVTDDEISFDDVQRAIESAKTVAIPQQVRKIIHVIPREYVVDSQGGIREPIGMSGSRLEVDAHIISALTTTVHNVEKAFQQLGIRAIPVFSGLASAESVLTKTEKELGVMVLDIGYGTTTITIYQEDAIAYSGCIILGGHAVTSDLAVGLQIQSDDAEKLKRNIGRLIPHNSNKELNTSNRNIPSYLRADMNKNNNEEIDDDLIDVSSLQIPNLTKLSKKIYEEIVGCRLDELFQMVSEQVSVAGFSVKQPAGVVLTGGGSNLYGIDKHAANFFGTTARVGFPQGLNGPLIDEITEPEFACVQGLILKGMKLYTSNGIIGGYDDPIGPQSSSVFAKISDIFKKFMP